jgi:hypothetical protein
MRRIGIVGAGQSGLQLAIGLRQAGYDVVLLSAQTAESIAVGRVTSSQCMFGTALRSEADLGLNFWDEICPRIEAIEFSIASQDRVPAVRWTAKLDHPAMSVDQRVKMPRFFQEFRARSGEIRYTEARLEDLEDLAVECELVIVSAGKGAIANIFERDAARSTFDRPMRALGLTYVRNLRPRPEHTAVCFSVIPGVGEYFVFPALTTSGPCEIMVFEGVPGGPMDCWTGLRSPADHLATSLSVLEQFVPWEFARARDVHLTDDQGILAGRFAPTVRHPIARLPSGKLVLGMADVVCLNDPITGQGSNNAAKCAAIYMARVLERGRDPFDAAWMQSTFDAYWDYARFVTDWTNRMLVPPSPHVLALLTAAGHKQEIADWFVNGFDDPRRLFPRISDPVAGEQFLQTAA